MCAWACPSYLGSGGNYGQTFDGNDDSGGRDRFGTDYWNRDAGFINRHAWGGWTAAEYAWAGYP